jgi:hypothetical protein
MYLNSQWGCPSSRAFREVGRPTASTLADAAGGRIFILRTCHSFTLTGHKRHAKKSTFTPLTWG